MKLVKWHQELDRFLDIKTTFLLEGNIFDLNAYPTKTDLETRWDMVMIDNYIYKYLTDNGYKTIVFYNHIDGFYNEFCPAQMRNFIEISGNKISKDAENFLVKPSQSADIVRSAMQNKTSPTAIVMMLASRYVINPENISEQERDFYAKLVMASLKKSQVKTEDGFKNNILFLVCEKANDV
ncbi:MAG: hypothetical protein RR540_02710, partial [Oscillospiraceae bacterium]